MTQSDTLHTSQPSIPWESLARTYGTPLYVYSADRIRQNVRRLDAAFKPHVPKFHAHYAVKANTNLHVLKILREEGTGADCASPGELDLALKAGFDRKSILYTGNYESPADLKTALDARVPLNLDDQTSLERLAKLGLPELLSFRINPGIGKGGFEAIITGGTDAKFGIPYEKAMDAYLRAAELGVRRFGIHMMTGSNILEPLYFAEITEKLLTIGADIFARLGVAPEFVDIGGGFGIPYDDDDQPLDVATAGELVGNVFRRRLDELGWLDTELVVEPGRYLVGDAGWLVSTVTGIKQSYRTFVGLDAGMNTLIRPALYGARHRTWVVNKDGATHKVNLVGQVCENADMFAKNLLLPANVDEGDLVVMADAGAYCYGMASVYNCRPRPAEVLIDGEASRLIRRRETLEDLLLHQVPL